MYYRTDLSSYTETNYPKIKTIKSVKELQDYYENNKGIYQFHNGFGGEPSMADAVFGSVTAYNADFFRTSYLLFVILGESSGSVRHRVESAVPESGSLSVSITRIIPEIGTADMAQWHIVLELDKALSDLDVDVVIKDEPLADSSSQ